LSFGVLYPERRLQSLDILVPGRQPLRHCLSGIVDARVLEAAQYIHEGALDGAQVFHRQRAFVELSCKHPGWSTHTICSSSSMDEGAAVARRHPPAS
jgi:hypothetical protein